jgi:uridine kinase
MDDLGDRRVESFRSLAESILALPGGVRLVAVDGYGGAGKSTFAARLGAALGGAAVVHTDDFATGESGVEWWPRLEREVIVPLLAGEAARYRRWDWEAKRLAEWHTVEPMAAVVIEGVSSARRAAADRLAYVIWVEAPAELRLERGLQRDGREALSSWDAWMAEEVAHFAQDGTRARCDLVVDGSPGIDHDPEREFVRIGGL